MATFRKRASGYWQAIIRRQGHKTQSQTFPLKSDAEAWARDRERDMDRGIFVDRREAETTTLRTALGRYLKQVTPTKKSKSSEERLISAWLERLELVDKPLAALKTSDFVEFRQSRLEIVSSQTVRHELKLISHLYNIAAREWSIPVENPLKSMKMPPQGKARERRVSKPEEIYLLAAASDSGARDKNGKSRANPWIAPAIRFALSTAMRQGEILGVEGQHIDRAKRSATLVDTKNGDRRVVPLAPSALAVLDALPVRAIRGPVFQTTAEALRQSWRRAVRRARRAYLADCKSIGIEPDPNFLVDLHFHDLRHEAISRLFELRPQIDIMRIAQITGHKTLQMLKRYTHLHSEDTADMLAAAGA